MKKFIILMTAVVIMFFMPPIRASAAEKSGYVYTIINNEATVTGFTGEPVYVEIPESIEGCRVTEIRDNAFYECGSLKHVTIPDTVEKIGHHAFYACFSLESISLPDSVSEIGMGCFCGCSALNSISLPENLSKLPDSCFRSCTSLKIAALPQSITQIGDFCFSGCTSLTTVSFGDEVTSLGDCSFYMCDSLKGIYVPPSVENIGVCAIGFIPTESGAAPLEDFTLLGMKKSAAQNYAENCSLTFENAEDSVHAFAIRKVSGQRVTIPSVFVIFGGILLILVSLILFKKRKRFK